MDTDEAVVVVTGFGPFRQYLDNPSWKAAQGLKLVGLGEDVKVVIRELPVAYNRAHQVIVDLWKTLNPKFAIHLGIATGCRGILLEQTGKNHGYSDRDVCGSCPVNQNCIDGGPAKLDSIVDMRALSKQLKKAGKDITYSRDAGRYLCDYVYYCSLFHGRGRAVFIHVPASGSLSSPDRLVPLLQIIIQTLLLQKVDSCSPSYSFLSTSSSPSSTITCSSSSSSFSSQINENTGTVLQ
ncbi:pyroglutamyl-peptidase 1 isoform X1 [Osmerus eperlanus]|uniref:pyroglutamyl-peptidase 1 isoform X1 n=1 Tax=Osmerus eperlanus TaxID=29151 RepID=UPI002E136B8B